MRGAIVAAVMLLVRGWCQGQVLQGVVIDDTDRSALVGATVILSDGSGTITDQSGSFKIVAPDAGRFKLTVNYLGYKELEVSDILLKSNQTLQLEIKIERLPLTLEAVSVFFREPFQVGGKRSINEDQIYRFASTYYDPARIMTTSPDVIITNDQNNQISVRGLSPNYNVWRLEGVEIVNPNHLSNAGTLNDQPSGTGGGVNAISAQILGNSDFHFGDMNAGFSNSVGGIFDLKLRSGNPQNFQYAAQASLIGFDFLADGPVSKNTQVLANYRYSFTGLLAQFGVDFGGERIGYQDLSVVSQSTLKNNGKLKLFATGGTSSNDFMHTGYQSATREKDLSDINYSGKVGVLGLRYDKASWSFSTALSGTVESRNQINYDSLDHPASQFDVENHRTISSTLLQKRHRFKNGAIDGQIGFNAYSWERVNATDNLATRQPWDEWLAFSGANWEQFISGRLVSSLGVTYYQTAETHSIDYRLRLDYLFKSSGIYASFGRYSQVINPANQFFNEAFGLSFNQEAFGAFVVSQRSIVGFEWRLRSWLGSVESFLYDFPKVQVFDLGTTNASTRGISANIQRNSQNGWFVLVGGTFFNSVYNIDINNRYNARYNGVANVGKEIDINAAGRRLEISMRQTVQGGNWYRIIENSTLLNPQETFSVTLSDEKIQSSPYLRTDLRIQLTSTKSKTTRTLSLDIQNLLNRENESFFYYDAFLQQELQNTQLGMIPNLTYRIDF